MKSKGINYFFFKNTPFHTCEAYLCENMLKIIKHPENYKTILFMHLCIYALSQIPCYFNLQFIEKISSQIHHHLKNLPANAGDKRDAGSTCGMGRSPGGGNSNPFQYSCLENPRGQRILAGYSPEVPKSQRQLKQLSTHKRNYTKSKHGRMGTLNIEANISCVQQFLKTSY